MKNRPVYVVMATRNRCELLYSRSLPSVAQQSYKPAGVVLVDDSDDVYIQQKNQETLKTCFEGTGIETIYLKNRRTPGAAGAWNSGIHHVCEADPKAWIAILDDDDEWTRSHLEVCVFLAENADIVLSGITTYVDGKKISDSCIQNVRASDFYRGNPGWQGSNTFIRVESLQNIGGYDEALLCTHDRDLAVRCINDGSLKFESTGVLTVRYYLDSHRNSLTMQTGFGKHTGLMQLFSKYSDVMSHDEKRVFITRAQEFFGIDPDLFSILNVKDDYPGFPRSPHIGGNPMKRSMLSLKYRAMISFGKWRSKAIITKIFGPMFKRSQEKIEIDLTYACNLGCFDCNRSCQQAPELREITLSQIHQFIDDSINQGLVWKRIRLLGGEPTLHSQFEEILYAFAKYKVRYPRTRLEVVTNGFGKKVKRALLGIPPFFHIENSQKTIPIQHSFYPFNRAPCDLEKFKTTDFSNGCSNLKHCGIGLTPMGYYPCAIAGGIDRIARWNIGRKQIPERSDDMFDILEKACPLCGRFILRYFIPYDLVRFSSGERVTKSWRQLYNSWRSCIGE